jgi:small subunit ribosomal protein S2
VDYVIPGNDDALRAIRLFTSKISESIAEGAQLISDKQLADIQAATSEAQAVEAPVATEYDENGNPIEASEDISMEEVLGPGTHKKPVAAEEADLPKVESQTV